MIPAAILATGNEITSGEVINTNGAWMAERLEEMGFSIVAHLCVPDDAALMRKALDWSRQEAQLIVVCGGLGPTSDDLTREIVAKWAHDTLVFSEEIWNQLQKTYEERHLKVRPAHRQQCYFPSRAQTIANPVGTALGFCLDTEGARVVVVPGPPRELTAMWEPHVVPCLQELSPVKDQDLLIWTCLGVTESEAAEAVEAAFQGTGLRLGYRASVPYVRVKLWVPARHPERQAWVERMTNTLKPWIVGPQGEDPLEIWLEKISTFSHVLVCDEASQGQLTARISHLKEKRILWPPQLTVVSGGFLAPALEQGLTLQAQMGGGPDRLRLGWRFNGHQKNEELALPFQVSVRSQRGSLYACELAIHWWTTELQQIQS